MQKRPIPRACIDLVKSFEGYHTQLPDGSCMAYLDTLAQPPVWTIGFGCTEGIKQGMIMTRDAAEEALARELEKHAEIVDRVVTVPIGENNRSALISFQYNTGGLPKSTLLKKLNSGDFDGAAREFERWNKAGGKIYKGLVRRRAAERALFEMDAKDDIPDGEPNMPQRVEPSSPPPAPATVATVGAAGGASIGTVVNSIPAAPDLSAAVGWQGFAQTLSGLSGFVTSRPLLVLAVIAIVVGVWLLPKWRQA